MAGSKSRRSNTEETIRYECPYCGHSMTLAKGSYAYSVSQVGLHFAACPKLSTTGHDEAMQLAAAAVTKLLGG